MNKETVNSEITKTEVPEKIFSVQMKEAERFIAMADKILLARFKEKYYLEAQKVLDKIPDIAEEPLTEEERQTLGYKKEEIRRKLNEARAYSVVEKYDFACKSREYAKTSEDLGSAQLHFKEAREARAKAKVLVELLSPECRRLYEETANAEAMEKECGTKAGGTSRRGRIKLLAWTMAAVLLCAGFLLGRHTATYRTIMGYMQLAIGLNDNAVKNFERAYKWDTCEKTHDAYIKALKKAGLAAAKKKDLTTASTYLHLPALEGDEEAAEAVVKAEMGLIEEAAVGDQIEFAGTTWLVLDREEDKLLLVRYEGLPSMAYQTDTTKEVSWENSDVRAYLNGEYLEENFNSKELVYMETTEVKAEANEKDQTSAGSDTEDILFILSNEEYEKYADVINATGHDCWLRSPGANEGTESYVDVSKNIMDYGYVASADTFCLKPVMWVSTISQEE